MGPCQALDTLPGDRGSRERHDPLCTMSKCMAGSAARLPTADSHLLSHPWVGNVTSPPESSYWRLGASSAMQAPSCSGQSYWQGPSPGTGPRERSSGPELSKE